MSHKAFTEIQDYFIWQDMKRKVSNTLIQI